MVDNKAVYTLVIVIFHCLGGAETIGISTFLQSKPKSYSKEQCHIESSNIVYHRII